jgi:hypothetical protein
MRQDVIVKFDNLDDISLHTDAAMAAEDASAWLDREYSRLECVAIRPTGKVLFADKVLAIAEAVGPAGFADAHWAASYVRAAAGALRRPLIRVDVPNTSVGF